MNGLSLRGHRHSVPEGYGMTAFFLTLLFITPVFAGDEGTVGAPSLKLGVGARGMALGEAYTAAARGSEALYWNPAQLVNVERPTFMMTYNPLVEDSNHSQAAFSMRLKSVAFGFGYNGVSHGSIDAYDDVGNLQGTYKAGDHIGQMGVAMGGDRFSYGLEGKYFSSKIDDKNATVFAADAGVSFLFLENLRHAVVARNMGGKISFITQEDPLPTQFTFGNALSLGRMLVLTADVGIIDGVGSVVGGGAEINIKSTALRGGYTTKRDEIEKLSGLSFGAALKLGALLLDYAWIPYGELGDSHAVTIFWTIPEFKRSAGKTSVPGKKQQRRLGDVPVDVEKPRKKTLDTLD